MAMYDWSVQTRAEIHRDELMSMAQGERMTRLAHSGMQGRHRTYCRLLCWMGRKLLAAGVQLQEQYGATTTPAALRS